MLRGTLRALVRVAAVGGVLGMLFVLSFRTRFRLVQDLIRRGNRRFINPRIPATAGQPGDSNSVVHHVGRSTGRAYRTPVVAVPDGEAFVIALPYGPGTDWVRNVTAAGSASITREGQTVDIRGPELVPIDEANFRFEAGDQRMHAVFGTTEVLRLHRVPSMAARGAS
jgi:deazaflavin-dependent oxidoreductase (nitroreductase family)